jgi:hypothetical protein
MYDQLARKSIAGTLRIGTDADLARTATQLGL